MMIGHFKLNKRLKNLELMEVGLCRLFQNGDESTVHVLFQCDVLNRFRFQILRDPVPLADLCTKDFLSKLKSVIRRTELDEIL